MKLFQRRSLPQPSNPQPVVPMPMSKPPEEQQFCSACGTIGAMHNVPGGDWYLGPIILRLCDGCHDRRIINHCNQGFKQRKVYPDTQVRLEAIDLAKKRSRGA